jgi:hypothetical protein
MFLDEEDGSACEKEKEAGGEETFSTEEVSMSVTGFLSEDERREESERRKREILSDEEPALTARMRFL